MSLIVATKDRIVADCYFATEGGPRKPFEEGEEARPRRRHRYYWVRWLLRLRRSDGKCFGADTRNEHGEDFVAGLHKDWSTLIAPYASENMASTEALVLFRAQGSNDTTLLDLDGKGYVIDLPENRLLFNWLCTSNSVYHWVYAR